MSVRWFGDREREAEPGAALAALRARLAGVAAAAPGPERHGLLAGALVEASALAQGLADAERAAAGADDGGPADRAALDLLAALARALWASWRAGGRTAPPGPELLAPLERLPRPAAIRLRRAEGHALYAVYPECHAAAARALAGSDAVVIGIRSIGAGLAAAVAAGAGLAPPLATVRPVGPPFRREVHLGPSLAARVAAARRGVFAVADEGPGQSGSSLAAAVAALEALGVPAERVHLFPSHAGGPGPEAGAEILDRWARAARHHVPFEALLLADHPLALHRSAEDVLGRAEAPPADLSAGGWRRHAFAPGDQSAWPPSQGWRERRKYLLRAGGRSWLARFAGLGAAGEAALARARALAGAGLGPAPAALRHGFLFVPWLEDAVPLPAAPPPPRAVLLDAATRHLAFIARAFPAAPDAGAGPAALLEAARANALEALGGDARRGLDAAAARLPEVVRWARPVEVDGTADAWDWLVRRDGALVKADALDHHADHGLAGCQDALWDVAGAELALGLTSSEGQALAKRVRAAAPGAPPGLLPFYRLCRAALELARWSLALGDGALDPAERVRRQGARAAAEGALRRALGAA
ncbi:conserved hypothetical protein [Anaeromyxobacter dehalogenans 2CP-1]|uniref:Uncharacterized protein n=1 Tax=Anaeromyxobacter dehalogenans (strain ATCC BAA-258 / DSM 21875 / 2CP-1) TaxID=455488 RepID=B8JA95_ANAD2|nr:hypothetical protein [Anaeromyxobacter dehalogenans]ACL65614.1 conserved hypothetical protein [Anaeromyxobacter dehalogenans 2CP-1]